MPPHPNWDFLIYFMTAFTGVMIVFVILMSIYYLVFWSISAKKIVRAPHSDKFTEFAVLIAARNESNVISHLLESLTKQTYSREHFEAYIIVERDDDPTIEIVKKYGFKYFVRDQLTEERKTKGFALQECIAYFKRENLHYDAYMIFDADNVLDSDYLETMNDLRQTGVKVGLGYRNFTNSNTNWLTVGSSIMFAYMNEVTNKGRSYLFHKATLMGTGYYVDSDIIDDIGGWIFTGMTEDIQLTSYCYYHDVYMFYYPLTSFYDEQSPKYKTVHNQHIRWLAGYFQRRKFLKKAGVQYDYHTKSMLNFMNFEYRWGVMPFVIFNVVMLICSIVNLVFGIWAAIRTTDVGLYYVIYLFSLAAFQMISGYMSFVLPAMITIIRDKGKMSLTTKNKIVGMLTYMFFFYDFGLAFLDGLFHPEKKTNWKRVEHTGEINNKNIEK